MAMIKECSGSHAREGMKLVRVISGGRELRFVHGVCWHGAGALTHAVTQVPSRHAKTLRAALSEEGSGGRVQAHWREGARHAG